MIATRLLAPLGALVLLTGFGASQAPRISSQSARAFAPSPVKREVAPLPNDPLELATGPTETLDTPQKRQAVEKLMQQARRNFALHARDGQPYTMKLTFTSTGHPHYNGPGEMEEVWANGQSWRWSA